MFLLRWEMCTRGDNIPLTLIYNMLKCFHAHTTFAKPLMGKMAF